MSQEDKQTPISETPDGVKFEDLGLTGPLLDAVHSAGYTKPTPIQWKAIPEVLARRDVLGIAQTGTGKTASFVLPMIEILAQGRAKARMPRTLILEPTRELAAQVAENFEKYGKNHKLTMALLIGGVSFGDQDAALMRGVDVLIATPGRLLDHYERGKLLLTGVQMLVIDEADRMLDMGFIPDIERIAKLTPFTRQTLFFSATMPPEIQRLTQEFLSAPVQVEVTRPAQAASTITQNVVHVASTDPKTKRASLRAVINHCMADIGNAIIFCNRKTDVDIVAKSLQKYGLDAAPIHGDLQQSQRMATLDKFRAGDLKLLVASDVAARGLDIPDVSHVFNYDVPRNSDDYVHRIGRTGRAGRLGAAYMLVAPADQKLLDGVEKLIQTKIDVVTIEGVPTEKVPDRFAGGGQDRARGRNRSDSGRSDSGRSDNGRAENGRGGRSRSRSSARPEGADVAEAQPFTGVYEASLDRAQDGPQDARPENRPRRNRGPRGERTNQEQHAQEQRSRADYQQDDGPRFEAGQMPQALAARAPSGHQRHNSAHYDDHRPTQTYEQSYERGRERAPLANSLRAHRWPRQSVTTRSELETQKRPVGKTQSLEKVFDGSVPSFLKR